MGEISGWWGDCHGLSRQGPMKSSTQEGIEEQLPCHHLLHGLQRVVCHILGKLPMEIGLGY